MSRANEPAYPVVFHNTGDLNDSAPNGEVVAPGCSLQLPGLTKRERFAMAAMQGLITRGFESSKEITRTERGEVVGSRFFNLYQMACHHADQQLAELAKERT
jgi:hypothetical protein